MKGIVFFLVLFVLSCSDGKKVRSTAQVKPSNPVKETIISNLARPWSMAFISEKEVLVAEKDGGLLLVNLETKERSTISGLPVDLMDTIPVYATKYEIGVYPTRLTEGIRIKFNAGLFQVLTDPNFNSNRFIYLSYAAQKGEFSTTKVIRAKLQNNELSDIVTLIDAAPYTPGMFHYGGGMVIGKDGKLYVTIGERLFSEKQQPPLPIAQNYEDRRGKIYRINTDGSIPEDNPDFGKNAVPGLYAVGIRAAQGMTLDPRTDDIWFTEHGTTQGDELNLLSASANYGWPVKTTGTYRGPGYVPPPMEERTFTDPIWSWYKTIAPTGLVFYTGDEFPEWKNNLIVPGLSAGNFWRLEIENNVIKSVEELFIDQRDRTRKAVVSPEGKLYILTDEANGRIIRIKNDI